MADSTNYSAANIVELTSIADSKIMRVSLYTGLAEVTRVCRPSLKEGDNKLVISGLPNVMVQESLRVEGRGPCTIHEVSITEIPVHRLTTTSLKLTDLLQQKIHIEKAFYRCKKSIESIDSFQNSLDVQHVDSSGLANVQRGIESVAEELDNKLLDLEEKLESLNKEIEGEKVVLGEMKVDNQLRQRVSITVFAERDCDVEIVLIYGVSNATWDAAYDIHVKMTTKEKPVTFIYKGSILQSTGEKWEDVSLTLETVTPTFGESIPQLQPWMLSVYREFLINKKSKGRGGGGKSRKRTQEMSQSASVFYDMEEEDGSPAMAKRLLCVSSKGDINVTFSVPGLMTIPSDGVSHNVTITELGLDADMSWVFVPKKTPQAHLTAKIKNDSEYAFLKGIASIYVDGSFISRSDVPAVSPQESFVCPLGIDPTIRVVYHPRTKKVNRSGFTRKTCSYIFNQRITITNTKSSSISNVKIHEQIPVSEDASITVNLTNPPLVVPYVNKKGILQLADSVKVNEHVQAQWDGSDEPEMDPSLLGKDGKFIWVCGIPAQGKLNLTLSWEVVCPYGTDIMGLDM